MKQDYQTITDIHFKEEKSYLLQISSNQKITEAIYGCFHQNALKKLLHQYDIYQQLYQDACQFLYQSTNYEEMEYHCVMMNHFFDEKDYHHIKENLLEKLIHRGIHLNEYCIIRHLLPFEHMPFRYFMNKLHDLFHVSYLDLAKICLVENQYHIAYDYLKELDDCHDQTILELLKSYSLVDYLLLMNIYRKKRKVYYLQTEN